MRKDTSGLCIGLKIDPLDQSEDQTAKRTKGRMFILVSTSQIIESVDWLRMTPTVNGLGLNGDGGQAKEWIQATPRVAF